MIIRCVKNSARGISSYALWMLLAMAAPSAALAQSDTNIVGYFVVKVTETENGTGQMSVSADNGTFSEQETYTSSLSSQARYAVRFHGRSLSSQEVLQTSSSASVSGAGKSTVTSKSGKGATNSLSWEYSLAANFDPSAKYLGAGWDGDTCDASPDEAPSDSSSADGGSPWGLAKEMANEAFKNAGSLSFTVPTNVVAWSFNKSHSGNYSLPDGGGASGEGSATVTATVSFEPVNQPKWEAVISFLPGPVFPNYETWLPVGGADEDHLGTNLLAMVKIQSAAGSSNTVPRASFTISLEDVSSEPGVCMNSPAQDQAKTTKDLKLGEAANMKIAEDGQSATSLADATSAGINIECYDYGAYGKLKVTARTEDGQTLVGYLDGHPDQTLVPIPKDDNENHIADAW